VKVPSPEFADAVWRVIRDPAQDREIREEVVQRILETAYGDVVPMNVVRRLMDSNAG
jgi:hypothetical protein